MDLIIVTGAENLSTQDRFSREKPCRYGYIVALGSDREPHLESTRVDHPAGWVFGVADELMLEPEPNAAVLKDRFYFCKIFCFVRIICGRLECVAVKQFCKIDPQAADRPPW